MKVNASFLKPTHNKQGFIEDNNYHRLMSQIKTKLLTYWFVRLPLSPPLMYSLADSPLLIQESYGALGYSHIILGKIGSGVHERTLSDSMQQMRQMAIRAQTP